MRRRGSLGWTLALLIAAVAVVGLLVTLLLPAIESARAAARRAGSVNHMKQLGLALHNHHDAQRKFPARAIFDQDGKPLLSWRVAILPYVGEEELYKQFRLDEAWDGPHNQKLIEQMPDVFRNPGSEIPPNTTTYLAPIGPRMMFEGSKARTNRDVRDGTSNTVMLVEANVDKAVVWTKPDDWHCDPSDPLAGLGEAHGGGFFVLFCSGRVVLLRADLPASHWQSMLTIADGD